MNDNLFDECDDVIDNSQNPSTKRTKNKSIMVDKETNFNGKVDDIPYYKEKTEDNKIFLDRSNEHISHISNNIIHNKSNSNIEEKKLELPLIQSQSPILEPKEEPVIDNFPELKEEPIIEQISKEPKLEEKEEKIVDEDKQKEKIDLSVMDREQLIAYYNKIKKEYLTQNNQLYKKKNVKGIQKETKELTLLFSDLEYIYRTIRPQNEEVDQNEEESITKENFRILTEITEINKEIHSYQKNIEDFLRSPDGIYKLILSTRPETKVQKDLLRFQKSYNSLVENYSALVDKIERSKNTIQKNEEMISKLDEMKDNLYLIANQKYQLNSLEDEDEYTLKKRNKKLVELRKKNQEQFGDHYTNKNILQDLIKQKEDDIMRKKRKINELERTLREKTEENNNIEEMIMNIYNPIFLGQENEKINEVEEKEKIVTCMKKEEERKNISKSQERIQKKDVLLSLESQIEKEKKEKSIEEAPKNDMIISQSVSRRRPNFGFKFSLNKQENIDKTKKDEKEIIKKEEEPKEEIEVKEEIPNEVDIPINIDKEESQIIEKKEEEKVNQEDNKPNNNILSTINNIEEPKIEYKPKPSFLDPEFADEPSSNNIQENKSNEPSIFNNLSNDNKNQQPAVEEHRDYMNNNIINLNNNREQYNEFDDLEEVVL